jgi:hypothetical protein
MFWAELFKAQEQTAMMLVPSATRERAVCHLLDVWLLCRALANWRGGLGAQVHVIRMLATQDHVVLKTAMQDIACKFLILAHATLWLAYSTQENRAQAILA